MESEDELPLSECKLYTCVNVVATDENDSFQDKWSQLSIPSVEIIYWPYVKLISTDENLLMKLVYIAVKDNGFAVSDTSDVVDILKYIEVYGKVDGVTVLKDGENITFVSACECPGPEKLKALMGEPDALIIVNSV